MVHCAGLLDGAKLRHLLSARDQTSSGPGSSLSEIKCSEQATARGSPTRQVWRRRRRWRAGWQSAGANGTNIVPCRMAGPSLLLFNGKGRSGHIGWCRGAALLSTYRREGRVISRQRAGGVPAAVCPRLRARVATDAARCEAVENNHARITIPPRRRSRRAHNPVRPIRARSTIWPEAAPTAIIEAITATSRQMCHSIVGVWLTPAIIMVRMAVAASSCTLNSSWRGLAPNEARRRFGQIPAGTGCVYPEDGQTDDRRRGRR